MKFDKLFEEVMGSAEKDLVDMIKSMPTDQLIGLYIEDLYALYTGGLFDRHDSDRAKQQINLIKQELLSRGESEEKLNTIEDDIKEEIIADEEGFEER